MLSHDVPQGVLELVRAALLLVVPEGGTRVDGAPLELVRLGLVHLHHRILLGPGFAEDGDYNEVGRKHDRRGDHADEQLVQGEGERTEVQGLDVLNSFVCLEEHAVGDHGEEQEAHAAGETLYAREAAAGRTRHHREPQMVVRQLLANRGGEEMFEGREVIQAGHGDNPVNHAVVLFHSQPAIIEENKPGVGKPFS